MSIKRHRANDICSTVVVITEGYRRMPKATEGYRKPAWKL